MSSTIKVSQIHGNTSEKELKDFFTFCGKINSIKIEGDDVKVATIKFEKPAAAKTALLLNETALNGQTMKVESLDDGESTNGAASPVNGDLRQEDKPRAAIFAEMLAQGYTLSDHVLERGIDFDSKHGISAKFTNLWKQWDEKYHVQDKVQQTDATYGVSNKLSAWYQYFHHYFEKALGTPTGDKVRSFYSSTGKQVHDVHEEAKRIQQKNKESKGGPAKTGTTAAAIDSAVSAIPAPTKE